MSLRTSTSMESVSFVFDTPDVVGALTGMKMCANRYTMPALRQEDGYTLLLLHAMGQHKEQWEPTLEKLFDLSRGSSTFRIREAWAFDWQNHGDSAIMNEGIIQNDVAAAPLSIWAAALAAFIQSDVVRGHSIIGVGFSSGTVALVLSSKYSIRPGPSPFSAIVLIEPSMMDQETWEANTGDIQATMDLVSKAAAFRRDSWISKEAALTYFFQRYPWNTWSPRIVQLYAQHALMEAVANDGTTSVKRKCPALQEASVFKVNLRISWEAMAHVTELCGAIPIHVIFGESVDLLPAVVRDCVVDTSKNRNVTSVTRIPDVGHMIVQEQPDLIGFTIFKLLEHLQAARHAVKL